jgi:hypothetical protein
MLLLVDSGSNHTFVNANFAKRLQCHTVLILVVSVKVANRATLTCAEMVPQLQWWAEGHSFSTDIKVLPLGGYDEILGVDRLNQWGDVRCNWATKTLKFDKAGHEVVLKGMHSKPLGPLQEMLVKQLLKLAKGNDI